jgi:hypothetical protein
MCRLGVARTEKETSVEKHRTVTSG